METIKEQLKKVKKASLSLAGISLEKRNKIIFDLGQKLLNNTEIIISENKKDLEKLDEKNILRDRLLLNESRIKSIVEGGKKLIEIKDPLKKYDIENEINTKEGLKIKKVGISLGVVACIYEARPNVTIDIFNMCIKSGNAVILRGGRDAEFSNNILVKLIKEVLVENEVDENIVLNFELEREKLEVLYKAVGEVDVIIPRGSKKLINAVREKSLVPVIETGAGVVHLFLDDKINKNNLEKAKNIIINAKISRPSVCNALDTLIISEKLDKQFIEKLFSDLEKLGVKILKDEKTNDYFKEQLSLNLNIKFVKDIDEAINHIMTYSTKHSDGILSDDFENIKKFKKSIDSSVVYVNTSTRFSDGEMFGFGGEIGISTQKLHARGPMGAEVLVTYKYEVESNYKMRN